MSNKDKQKPMGVNSALYNANPVSTDFITPDGNTFEGEYIAFRILGDMPTLTACIFNLDGEEQLNLSDLDGFDNGDWHWFAFDEIVTVSSSAFLIEAVTDNTRTLKR